MLNMFLHFIYMNVNFDPRIKLSAGYT